MTFVSYQDLTVSMQEQVWGIYEYSFPTHEKRTLADHKKALLDSRFHADAVLDEGILVGLLFYWELEQYAYIEHFAIDRERRGQNYGTRILTAFCKQKKRVLLEIDPPIDQISKNREHFYHRLGFISSPFAYTHPAYRKEYVPHTLVLMSYPDPISETVFEEFKEIMFRDIMRYSGKELK